MDASSSIRSGAKFQLVMNFVTDIIRSFARPGGRVRYGLAVFGSRVKVGETDV